MARGREGEVAGAVTHGRSLDAFLTARQQFAGELQVFKIHKEMPRILTKMIAIAEVRPNGTRAVVDDGSVLFHRKRWGRFWWTQSDLGRLLPR